MIKREIERIFNPPSIHMVGDGFRMHNFVPGIPTLSMERMDPFLMLDYHSKDVYEPTTHQRGVGSHPHKGFETVTISYHGSVAHKDSTGNGGVIRKGDVQWMTAANGIIHSEFHDQEWAKTGGLFQMAQIWVNLPKKDKSHPARYQNLMNDLMTRVPLEKGGYVEVISGEYNGNKGPAKTFTPIHLMNAKMKAGETADFTFADGNTTFAIVIEGSVTFNGERAEENQLVLFKSEGETFTIGTDEDAIVLVLSGTPIKEPIFAYGPFVMNTREEIIEAFNDFNSGKFGNLED